MKAVFVMAPDLAKLVSILRGQRKQEARMKALAKEPKGCRKNSPALLFAFC